MQECDWAKYLQRNVSQDRRVGKQFQRALLAAKVAFLQPYNCTCHSIKVRNFFHFGIALAVYFVENRGGRSCMDKLIEKE